MSRIDQIRKRKISIGDNKCKVISGERYKRESNERGIRESFKGG